MEILKIAGKIVTQGQATEIDIPLIGKVSIKYDFKVIPQTQNLPVRFIDGGSAQIFANSSTSVEVIRIASTKWYNGIRQSQKIKDYLAIIRNEGVRKEATLVFDNHEQTVMFSANDDVASLIRSQLELQEGLEETDCAVFDGALTHRHEMHKNVLLKLKTKKAAWFSKTTSILANDGSDIFLALKKSTILKTWFIELYNGEKVVLLAKLHPQSEHIFQIDLTKFDPEIISTLASYSNDPVFLGYPYGLVYTDRLARITDVEKEYLTAKLSFVLDEDENKSQNLKNAHKILDSI